MPFTLNYNLWGLHRSTINLLHSGLSSDRPAVQMRLLSSSLLSSDDFCSAEEEADVTVLAGLAPRSLDGCRPNEMKGVEL
jgi:hypothetical protein